MTWLPLTSAQRGLFFAHHLEPDNPCYTTAEVVEFPAGRDGCPAVDAATLAAAVTAAHDEFEQVRTEYALFEHGPVQRVLDRTVQVQVLDVEGEQAAEKWIQGSLARPMDLATGDVVRTAVLRLADGRVWWFHAAHHVVLDGYGAQHLIRRVAEHHDALLTGVAAPSAPQVSVADLVAADAADEGSREAQRRWWAPRLQGMGVSGSTSGRTAPPAGQAIKKSLALPPETVAAIAAGSRQLRVAWPDLVVAAIGVYLARVQGADEARVGLPQMNRSRPGVGVLPAGLTVCSAMNVLPVTVEASAQSSVGDVIAATALEQAQVREHALVRQEELTRSLERLSGVARAEAPLFGAQVNLVPFDLEVSLGGVPGLVRNLTAGPVEDMTVCLRGTPRRGRSVRLEIDANPALHEEETVAAHLRRLSEFLAAFASASATTPVGDVPLADQVDLAAVVAFNATSRPHEAATLGERFLDQVARTPQATALVFRGETLTYAALADRAGRIADLLGHRGVRAGDVVGVCLPRGLALYATVHAIALMGAVYLPIDPDLPTARVEMMLEDAIVPLIVVDGERGPLPRDLTATAVLDLALPPDSLHAPQEGSSAGAALRYRDVDVDELAYLLFTSGSTGRPKGVAVGHRAIDNRLAWMQHACPLAPGDRVLHKTPISFDVSIWELYWPLQVGGCVVIAEPGAHRDPRAVADLVVDEHISTLHFVPSMLRAFLADRVSAARVRQGQVRTVVTSGEALTPDLVRGCADAFGVPPLNLYGPTEAAVDVTSWQSSVDDAEIPIGRPVWNTTCHVLDASMKPMPVGVPGELWLGGVQLAHGYVGRRDLTAERFVPAPFAPAPFTEASARLYRTGDLAAWRPDGALRYLGRTDDQVKVRGQRLELGEVELALTGMPGVVASCAGVVGEQLVVWFAPVAGHDPDALVASLRAAAARCLPTSMLPSHWIPVDAMPTGSSGKTDRATLAHRYPPHRRDLASEVRDPGALAPHDLAEQRACVQVADVLGLERVGPDDDFFDLGGDSLTVLRLLTLIEGETGHRLELADVFAAPTPRGIASLLATQPADAVGSNSDLGEVLTLRAGRPQSGRSPLFLLPPAGGLGWCYLSLLRHLPADLAVHTIQAPGLASGAPEPVADLVTLGRRQLSAIRTVVGHAPFHVAGWSLGGMAAHTVAALARADDQQVGATVLLDAYPSEQWQHLDAPTEPEALRGILRLAGAPDDCEDKPLTRGRAIARVRDSGSALAALPEAVLEGCLTSVVEAARLVRSSRHPVLDGDLDVIIATVPRSEDWLSAVGWKRHTVGEVREHAVAVGHGDLVRSPAVEDVASVLTQAMKRSGVDDTPVTGENA